MKQLHDLPGVRTALAALALGPLMAAASPSPVPAQAGDAAGELTRVVVRAQAQDAKIIGSNVGGAEIEVRDAETGALLARGVQAGSTGDTRLLMRERPRRGAYATEGAAEFVAALRLTRPTLVDITARGPLGAGTPVSATKRLLLVPGVDVLGDGVVLELNGLTVEVVLAEAEVQRVDADGTTFRLRVRARVTMLCGCPIEPGGLWDAAGVRVRARLVRGEAVMDEKELGFAGEASTFKGVLEAPSPGSYRVEVVAVQPAAANFGRGEIRVVVP